MLAGKAFFLALTATLTAAHPLWARQAPSSSQSAPVPGQSGAPGGNAAPGTLDILAQGNKKFRDSELFKNSQKSNSTDPSFMVLGCADNSVPEDTIFGSQGNIFHQDNLANMYSKNDTSADSAITYAVNDLGVTHVIVMGHYGCSSVAAAIADGQGAWSAPLRELYQSSNRTEIAKARDNKMAQDAKKLNANDPAMIALVEENIKANVKRLHDASAFGNSTSKGNDKGPSDAPARQHDVFVHGLVYNATSGEVMDLGVSFGPDGKEVPKVPFAAVQGAKDAVDGAHTPLTTTVLLEGETVTVTATPSGSASSEAVATTTVKGAPHTITVSALPSGASSAAVSSGVPSSAVSSGDASSKNAIPVSSAPPAPPVTTTVTVDGETITVTATPSSPAGPAVVTTTVKGEAHTITVSGNGQPPKSQNADGPSSGAAPSKSGGAAEPSKTGGNAEPSKSGEGAAPSKSEGSEGPKTTPNAPVSSQNAAPSSSANNDDAPVTTVTPPSGPTTVRPPPKSEDPSGPSSATEPSKIGGASSANAVPSKSADAASSKSADAAPSKSADAAPSKSADAAPSKSADAAPPKSSDAAPSAVAQPPKSQDAAPSSAAQPSKSEGAAASSAAQPSKSADAFPSSAQPSKSGNAEEPLSSAGASSASASSAAPSKSAN